MYARLATMPLNGVYIAAATLTVGTLFYGIYAVLFFLSVYLFVHRYNAAHSTASRKRNSMFKSVVFGSAILLFMVVTTVRPRTCSEQETFG